MSCWTASVTRVGRRPSVIVSLVTTHLVTSRREGSSNWTSSRVSSRIERRPRAPVSRSRALSAIASRLSSAKTSSMSSNSKKRWNWRGGAPPPKPDAAGPQGPLYHLVELGEGAAADEEDVGGVDREELLVGVLAPALRRHARGRPLEDLQQRLLHALARHVARDRRVV